MPKLELHQLMVLALVRKFYEDGYELKGATYFSNLAIPPKIGKSRPDVLALETDGTLHIGEAKIKSNLASKFTREQFADYLEAQSPNGKPAHLHIIVELNLKEKLIQLLEYWRFEKKNINIWTY